MGSWLCLVIVRTGEVVEFLFRGRFKLIGEGYILGFGVSAKVLSGLFFRSCDNIFGVKIKLFF